MTRIRQFAKDMSISYDKAKKLIDKGKKRKDGGSNVLEGYMPIIITPIEKKKKKKVPMPKPRPKSLKADKTESLDKEFSKNVAKQNEKNMREVKKKKGGGFPDLSGDGKTTMKDILIGRGVIKKSRGGGIAVQGTGFRGVR